MGHTMARGLHLVWTTNGSCHGSWVSGLLIGMQWFRWVPIAMVEDEDIRVIFYCPYLKGHKYYRE